MKDKELDRLISDWLSDRISSKDLAILDRRLREGSTARSTLRQMANLDSGLREWATRDQQSTAWLDTQFSSPRRPGRRWQIPLGLAAATALSFAAYHFGGMNHSADTIAANAVEQTSQGVAILTQTVDANWSGKSVQPRSGDSLSAGPLSLASGFAQIEFFSGATLVVEGPAEFEVVSPWQVKWTRGKTRVRVPPSAHGFELLTPGMKLVDLGTEFGVELGDTREGTHVQVFSGEVEAYPPSGEIINLVEGQALHQVGETTRRHTTIRDEEFSTIEQLQVLTKTRADSHFSHWLAQVQTLRNDSRLLAFYDFQRNSTTDRLVPDISATNQHLHDGGVVGAVWSTGRWPQKDALEFKRPGDRVRLQIEGSYDAITLATWVRVDGLDRQYNSLLLTDGYEPGEPHWQIFEDGRLMFSLCYPNRINPDQQRNRIYYSPAIFDRANTGRWHHVVVTYDNQSGAVIHYVNGVEVSHEIDEFHVPGRPIIFGASELGNWGLPTIAQRPHKSPIRNLNGRMDEFAIFAAALSADEIRALHAAGNSN